MWPYWLMFLLPALAALSERRLAWAGTSTVVLARLPPKWKLTVVALALVVGYRFQAGGDWGNYLANLESAYWRDFWESVTEGDPGYRLLEWVAVQMGWGVFGVNLVAAALFALGLVNLCRALPRPWLALAIAVPYLVIVVGMGYSRQGMALGCAMFGLVALGRVHPGWFVFLVLLGATFHKSAVLLLPIAALAATQRRWLVAFWVAVITAGAYWVLLSEAVESLRVNYLEAEYQSEGALVRLLMNALPAALLLLKEKRFALTLPQERLWRWFAIISLALLGWYFVSPSSTAVDRIALYMLPLQLVVFAYVPEVLGRRQGSNRGWVVAVLLLYALVQFVWLNFATHAFAWLPYRWYPVEWLFS